MRETVHERHKSWGSVEKLIAENGKWRKNGTKRESVPKGRRLRKKAEILCCTGNIDNRARTMCRYSTFRAVVYYCSQCLPKRENLK